MKQKLENKDEMLECNLSTVLGAIRGSSGYWNRVCSDLNVMKFLIHIRNVYTIFNLQEF